MAWWQGILVVLGSIGAGLVVGIGVYFAIAKLKDRTKAAAVRRDAAVWAAAPVKTEGARTSEASPGVAAPTVTPTPRSVAQPKSAGPPGVQSSAADLVAEVEANRRLATGAWNGKLQQFQTRAWDSRGDEVHELAPDLRDQLAEAYSDMSLANSIVWLATEMGRRSESLDDSYVKLRTSIAGRLDRASARIGAPSRPVSPPG